MRKKRRSGVGLTLREVTRQQLIQPDRAGMSREELGAYNILSSRSSPPASLPAQPPSFLPLFLPFFSSPPFCWQPSPNKMQYPQQVCPAAACCSCLHAALNPNCSAQPPPGSCHLTLASPAGVRGLEGLLPSASLRQGGGRPIFWRGRRVRWRLEVPRFWSPAAFHRPLLFCFLILILLCGSQSPQKLLKGGDCCSHSEGEKPRFRQGVSRLSWVTLAAGWCC